MEELTITKKMFGGEIIFQMFDTPEIIARDLVDEAYTEGLRLQKIFNFYDSASTLSILNMKRSFSVPPEFIEVLNLALSVCAKTKGRYDISLGKQFIQRKKGIDVTEVGCSYKDIVVSGKNVKLLHADALIDFGSIAKGYITDKMAEFLISRGIISGLIDSRGDIRVFGKEKKIIEVQHPRDKDKSILKISLKNGGIATSGDYNQYKRTFDESHIINQKDYCSVTVVADTLMEADVYATAVFVTPRVDVQKLLHENKDVKVCCVDKSLKIKMYNDFEEVMD